ncbi:MAG: helix-turn-helix domain-containing protein [Firmicutes bacterium]|nr:helix-turn-helix domain-containing protein [Bacillota bacterium]
MELSLKIAEIRKAIGLTQDELAEKLFVTRQAVSRWERGETTPSLETLKALADLYKIDANALLGTKQRFCQSCGMPLMNLSDLGANADNGANFEYCHYCIEGGEFKDSFSIDEMAEHNLNWLKEWNEANGTSFTKDEARPLIREFLSALKRWK